MIFKFDKDRTTRINENLYIEKLDFKIGRPVYYYITICSGMEDDIFQKKEFKKIITHRRHEWHFLQYFKRIYDKHF